MVNRPTMILPILVVGLLLGPVPVAEATPPAAPRITEPSADGITLNASDIHMEATDFNDPDGHSHECTEWQIVTGGGELVWQVQPPCLSGVIKDHVHFGDGFFLNSHAGRSELLFGSSYRVRVRFRDSNDELSAWSERPFTTAPLPPPGTPSSNPWLPMQAGFAVEEVAGGFQLPVSVAFANQAGTASEDPLAYVAELYGSIRVVTRGGAVHTYATNLLNFDPTGSFPGSGEMGVTGLAVQPGTGDVFASLVYESGGAFYGRVVRFQSTNGGLTATNEQSVLDLGLVDPVEPQGPSHQISNLTFGPDGSVFVHQGDAHQADKAQDVDSYLGKILRFDPGNCGPANPAAPNCAPQGGPNGNPHYNPDNGVTAFDYIYARGFRNPFGGDWRRRNQDLYSVENGPVTDRMVRIGYPPQPGTSQNFGWSGDDVDFLVGALYTWRPSRAPIGIAFVEAQRFGGSGFPPGKRDHGFVTESGPTYAGGPQPNGKRVVEFPPAGGGELAGPPTTLVEYTGTGKATAAGIAAGPDGVYFTELYKDLGYSSPIDPGARLLRIRYFPPTPTCTLSGRTLQVALTGAKRGKKGKGKGKRSKKKRRKRNRGARKTTIARSGNQITVGGHWCGATVDNIDRIAVTGARGRQDLRVNLRGGPFAPGVAPEPEGEPEIEIGVALGKGRDRLIILRMRSNRIRASRRSASFNDDGDSDLTAAGVKRVTIKPKQKKRKRRKR